MKILIVGAGEVGFHIAGRLALENKDAVIIDKNQNAIRRVSDNIDVQVVSGSGASPVIMEEAGIHEAELLLAVTDSDETNLVSCMVADMLSSTTKKIARIRSADYDNYHEKFKTGVPHIDTIINPEVEVVKTIDRLMTLPGAVDVGEFAEGRVKFVGIQLNPESKLANTKLADLPAKVGDNRLLIAAVSRKEELIIPGGKDILLPNDIVYFISEQSRLNENFKIFHQHAEPVRNVVIVGGGRIGFRLAALLEKKSVHTRIIEKDPDRCKTLAEHLNKAVVLHGDGSDQELLKEENIHKMDIVVTLTNDEETNILVSLLVKRLGVKKTITKISKFSYFPLMSAIGIEQVVNPRLSAINSILQHIRRGKILSAISIKGEQAEVVEAVAMETSDIVGKPLMDVNLPKGVLVTGVVRDQKVIIPSGTTVILPNDRIIIFCRREAIPKMEKILAVKLRFF